jgi:DNA-directed RNA polymerase subunit M/transcription elongation factor TFIIS
MTELFLQKISVLDVNEVKGDVKNVDIAKKQTSLNRNQIDILLNSTYKGMKVKILDTEKNKFILYEIAGLLYALGFDAVVKLLNNDSNFDNTNSTESTIKQTNNGILFGNDMFKKSQETELLTIETLKIREYVGIGAFLCVKCGSDKTTTRQKQIKGGDENMSSFNSCNACGYKWRIG